jgi:hypothetical protein
MCDSFDFDFHELYNESAVLTAGARAIFHHHLHGPSLSLTSPQLPPQWQSDPIQMQFLRPRIFLFHYLSYLSSESQMQPAGVFDIARWIRTLSASALISTKAASFLNEVRLVDVRLVFC